MSSNENQGSSDMEVVAKCRTPLRQKIGFIGSGKMAMALAKGFMANGLVSPCQVYASAPSDRNLALWRQLGASTSHKNTDIIKSADIIFLAVKPNIFPQVVNSWHDEMRSDTMPDGTSYLCQDSKVFVSVMVGLTCEALHSNLSGVVSNPRIVRVMPNTPSLVGCGASAVSLGSGATKEDADVVKQLLLSVGMCELVPEYQQNAVAGLIGSGPAFMYTIIEGLADGAVSQGVPRDLAVKFAAQTVIGSAKMVLESGKHTGQLKDEVTSPGGMTIRGVQVIDRAGVRGTLMDAIQAATERAIELGKN